MPKGVAEPNSEDASLYQVLLTGDTESMEEAVARLVAGGATIQEALAKINEEAQKATTSIEKMAAPADAINSVKGFSDQINEAVERSKALGEQLAEATAEANGLNKALVAVPGNLPEQGFINNLPMQAVSGVRPYSEFMAQQAASGGGGYAGGGPEFADQIPTPASGGTGSLFGIGHALSVAGFTTGIPGLKEAGAVVYMEEGLKRALPLLQQFGETIVDSSPGLTNLIANFTGLSAPMAGLLGVVAPLAVAVGGLIIGMQAYNSAVSQASGLLSALIKGQDDYYTFIQTATTKEAKDKVQSLEDSNVITKRKLDENVNIIKSYLSQVNIPVPLGEGQEFIDNLERTGTATQLTDKVTQEALEAAKKYAAQLDQNNIFVNRLTGDLNSNKFATNDAAEAAKLATQAAIAKTDNDAQFQRQVAADMQLGLDPAKKRLEFLQQEGPIIQGQMDALKPYIATNEDARKKYDELNNQLGDNVAEIQILTNVVIPMAQHAKDLADGLKAADEALKAAKDAHDRYLKGIADGNQQLADQTYDAARKEQQAEAQLKEGSIQDAYQRSQIVLDEQRKEKAAIQDTANAIADVRTKLGQQEVADLTAYNRKLMDDQTKYQQDVQKDQTSAYRKEQDNYQEHIQKLADIQAKQATDQQDALLNRNFLALAKVQEGKQNEIDAENTAYARKQAAVQQNLQREIADLATHQAEARTQQFVEYQRKLVDDRLHAQQEIDQKNVMEGRKLAEIRLHEQQQLVDLTTTENYKIQILRQGFAQEILEYEIQNNRRLRTLQQQEADFWRSSFQSNPVGTAAAAVGQDLASGVNKIGSFFGSIFGNTRDSGGAFGAGEIFSKGNIPEMFNFGGAGSYSIPGAAVVMPLKSGTATPTGGGSNINLTLQIAGTGDRDIPAKASKMVYDKLQEFFADQ